MRTDKRISGTEQKKFDNETAVDGSSLDAETLRKILDNCYDEVFVLDADDRVIYVNSVCERHYGMKASEVIGKSVYDLFLLGYWYPPITPTVRNEKRRVTAEQTTYMGRKLITTVTPVFDEKGEIELTVHNARDLTQLDAIKQELVKTREELAMARESQGQGETPFCEIIAHSQKMKELIEFATHVAGVDSNILILGESGTGKGLFARHIHRSSRRRDGPFLALNCAAIPENLLESELFGYSHGAFTGAERGGKQGLIEAANGGTLFLDEIADLSPRLQAKILQVIQERQFIPIGSTKVKQADVRILAATNRDLLEMVKTGAFRKDLYYRLNIIKIDIPPLRERPEDVIPLVFHFLVKFNKKYSVCKDIAEECLESLCRYSWPGNVRELENLVERLVVTVREPEIRSSHIPELHTQGIDDDPREIANIDDLYSDAVSLDSVIEEVEKGLITRAYKQHGSSRKVAQALKISQSRASRLIRKYR